jgi:hypothetical protein
MSGTRGAAFGFRCGKFDLAVTAQNHIVPGSKGTLKFSMLKHISMNDAAGKFLLTVEHEGKTVYRANVVVSWLGHSKEPEPFLGFQCDDTIVRAST